MSWAELHSESERLAIEAQFASRAGNSDHAVRLYKQAAEFERRALDQLDISKARTRGVTAVSAVALWFKGREYVVAEQLAYSLLADSSTPEFARDELRTLVQAIWTESTKQKAGVAFVPGQVLVSVKGGDVVVGGAPLDLVVDKVQTIQSMFFRTVELLRGMSHRRMGRPSKEIQESCRPWLFQSAPGSYQFSVAIQRPTQSDFFRQDVDPERIAQQFLEILSAAGSNERAALEKAVPDEEYRRTFLKLARHLAPTGKSFEQIEFRASGSTSPVVLGLESRSNIVELVKSTSPPAPTNLSPEEIRGTLRALHLDKDWLEVLSNGVSMHVEGLEDAVDDVIGPMVNRSVVVRVVRMSEKKLKFVDIELVE